MSPQWNLVLGLHDWIVLRTGETNNRLCSLFSGERSERVLCRVYDWWHSSNWQFLTTSIITRMRNDARIYQKKWTQTDSHILLLLTLILKDNIVLCFFSLVKLQRSLLTYSRRRHPSWLDLLFFEEFLDGFLCEDKAFQGFLVSV